MNPKGQNLEAIHRIVGTILRRAGCEGCGMIALLRVDFLSDPPQELGKDGVISFTQQGF
jgi:hypothetical protein